MNKASMAAFLLMRSFAKCVKRLGFLLYIFEDRRRSSVVDISPLGSRKHRKNQ
jgi:hypothetical protein